MFLIDGLSVLDVDPTGWMLQGYDLGVHGLIYPTQMSFVDGALKRRGGSHVIGPAIGKPLPDGPFVGLPQHGHWRNRFFTCEPVGEQKFMGFWGSSASGDFVDTRYPYATALALWTSVLSDGFAQGFAFHNLAEDQPAPLQVGFHPYFWVKGAKVAIEGGNNQSLEINPPVAATVYGHTNEIRMSWPYSGGIIRATLTVEGIFTKEPAGWVIWSDDQEYLCVEPFSHIDRTEYLMVGPGKMATGAFQVRFCVE